MYSYIYLEFFTKDNFLRVNFHHKTTQLKRISFEPSSKKKPPNTNAFKSVVSAVSAPVMLWQPSEDEIEHLVQCCVSIKPAIDSPKTKWHEWCFCFWCQRWWRRCCPVILMPAILIKWLCIRWCSTRIGQGKSFLNITRIGGHRRSGRRFTVSDFVLRPDT